MRFFAIAQNDAFSVAPTLSPFFTCHPEALAEGSPPFRHSEEVNSPRRRPEQSEGTHSDYRKKGGDSSLTLRMTPSLSPFFLPVTLFLATHFLPVPFFTNHPFFVTLRALARRVS